jgi:hypothetical protein
MKVINSLSLPELQEMSNSMFGSIVKAVVDIDQKIIMVDAPMHFDLEQELLSQGSAQNSLWGINFHPKSFGTSDFVEFDSMINIRPRDNNFSRGVEDEKIREIILKIVEEKLA